MKSPATRFELPHERSPRSPDLSFSSEIAQEWSATAQSQAWPEREQIPWPYCVTLKAVQLYAGSAAINPATTLVLPTLRECPPITTIAIYERVARAPPAKV